MIAEHYPISFAATVACAAVEFYAIHRSKGASK
jgi:hypothetical protein